MEKEKFMVKVFGIDYLVEEEDLDVEDIRDVDAEIRRIKNELPKEFVFEVYLDLEDCADEVVEYYIANRISETTGWLVNSFRYERV